jgi:hypothetical protein
VEDEIEWQVKTMRDERDTLGDQCDLPKYKGEVQKASLQKESQSMEQMDEAVEEIMKLMLESEKEFISAMRLDERKYAQETRMM